MLLKYGQNIINQEVSALKLLSKGLGSDFLKIVNSIIQTKGKIIVSGVGKSGHIASKIASTLTSTGSKALFMHPTEASHGDLGLLDNKDLPYYVFEPTSNLVHFTKSLNTPVICFPRGIKDYKKYCDIINPDAISIDYEVDPSLIKKEIQIPVQGGMDPKILLTDKENLKKEAKKYLDIFKDHPYIFNLGHGVLPETDPNMMDYLVKMVKDY